MPERMIKCPECGGIGDVTLCSRVCPSFDETIGCPLCSGSGTIPDRRKPTASDRAVERIKARCEQEMDADVFHAVGGRVLADIISVIIREEAERHE